jgi:alpha-tubulin suppressor-like RCC1 family protein
MKHWTLALFGGILLGLITSLDTHASTRAPARAETLIKDSQVHLSAGSSHSCHLRDDGTGRCWGLGSNGQLGDGTTTNRSRPTPVTTSVFSLITFQPLPLSTTVRIAAGALSQGDLIPARSGPMARSSVGAITPLGRLATDAR